MPTTDPDDRHAQHPLQPRLGHPQPGHPAAQPVGSGQGLSRLVRQLVQPHRGPGGRAPAQQRHRRLRRSAPPTPWHPGSSSVPWKPFPRKRCSSCSAAGTAKPTCCRRPPGTCSARRRPAGDASRPSATSCITTSSSATASRARRRPPFKSFQDRKGVCRDFAHLAVTLCRCMNIPARYCTGYLGDIGCRRPMLPWTLRPGSRPTSATAGTRSILATTRRGSGAS